MSGQIPNNQSSQFLLYIDGSWHTSKQLLDVYDKYTGAVFARVVSADERLIESALLASQNACKIMRKLSAHERSEILEQVSNLIRQRQEDFVRTIMLEAGKPVKLARIEVERAVQTFKFAAEQAKQIHGETIPLDAQVGSAKRFGFFIRQPVGVVVAITPFNFPLNLVAHKVAPALACGCSVIHKPSSFVPVTAIKLAEVMQAAGVPAGAYNVLVGKGYSVGNRLVTDHRVALISFTGSADVGRWIKEKSGLKRVVLELGNNSACIVDESAEIEYAVNRCVSSAFAYSGQVCISLQRLYLAEKIADRFLEQFISETQKIRVGDPGLPDTDVGPMISETEAIRIEEWVNEAVEHQAKVLLGGRRTGCFFQPTILLDVNPNLRISREEAFGPIVCVYRFNRFQDALYQVNDSDYGLQTGVFTNDLERVFSAIRELQVGGVIINDVPSYRTDNMPYGGIKKSGIGREGIQCAMEEMTYLKMVCLNLRR